MRRKYEELKAAHLVEGEEEQLKAEREACRSSEKILEALEEAKTALYDPVTGSSCLDQAERVMRAMAAVSGLGSEYQVASMQAEELYYNVQDLSESIRRMLNGMENNPQRTAELEDRLDLIKKLSRRYGATTGEMLVTMQKLGEELDLLDHSSERLDLLHKKALEAYQAYNSVSSRLSSSRSAIAADFSRKMEEQLDDLNMKGTRFFVRFAEKDKVIPTATGVDEVCFMIAPNKGEEAKELSRIASGGELSRVMLAIKTLLAGHDKVPSMVFDEIDTGISGRAAQVVAEKMCAIARYRQVICVTHLQQIAAMAEHHILVQKGENAGRTNTRLCVLDTNERIEEIARMISGTDERSESALNHAAHMLESAENYRRCQQSAKL